MTASRAVLVLAALLGLWNLWGYDLWAPDEPYFAEGAREMLADGQWAVPHVNGTITTDKPPLFFWIIALLSLPAGRVTPLTARLPSALAGLGSVVLAMRLARRAAAAPGTARLAPEAPAVSGEADAGLAGLVLATTHLHWDKARSAQIDALLAFLILAALSAFVEFRAGRAAGRRSGLLFWGAAALAVLAKGPVGLLLPLGVALATLAWDRNLRAWRRFAPCAGPALFVMVVGAWMVLATAGGHGEYSVWGAFERHVLKRAVFGMHHVQPPWYYLQVLPVELLPWSALVPGALLLAWRRRGDPADRFLLAWAGFIVLFFSLSTEKRDLYVLPACPAFALLVARLVRATAWPAGAPAPAVRAPAGAASPPRTAGAGWVTVPLEIVATVLAAAGIAAPLLARRFASGLAPPALAVGAVLVAAGGAILAAALAHRPLRAVLVTAAGASATYLVAVSLLYPALDPMNSARAFALEVRRATAGARAAGERVVSFGLGNLPEAIAFNSDGVYLQETADPSRVAAHLEREAEAYAVADAARLPELPPGLRERIIEVSAADLNRKHVVLLRRRPGEREAAR